MPTNAWTYADWRSQTGDAARLARLRLHQEEVSGAIRADVAGGGMSRSSSHLVEYLKVLNADESRLMASVDGESAASGLQTLRVV